MMVSESDASRSRTFTVSDDEWFDRTSFGQKAEDIIAWKLAETFTIEELQKLVKIDVKRIEEKVIEKVAEKVVRKMSEERRFYRKEKVSKSDGQEIMFEDLVRTPPEKQEQVDALIDKCIKLSCEEQNKKYPLS